MGKYYTPVTYTFSPSSLEFEPDKDVNTLNDMGPPWDQTNYPLRPRQVTISSAEGAI